MHDPTIQPSTFAHASTCAALVAALAASGVAQMTTRVSVSSAGVEGNGISIAPAISADGHFVAFASDATNLVAGDTNNATDVFVRDRYSGQTSRVSVGPSGAQANYGAYSASISGDGRYVAFLSTSTNLVAGDTNASTDVFVRDRQTGQTRRVSVDSSGAPADQHSWQPSFSVDGRWVAFRSDATNLVAGDTNNQSDVFVHDLQSSSTTRVSVGAAGVEANAESVDPSISADGRYVALASGASNLVPADANGCRDVFVHDRATGQVTRVDVSSAGAEADYGGSHPSISADGRYVAFVSLATNLVAGDTNMVQDVFVHDRQTAQTRRVSVSSSGAQASLASDEASISANGRFVAFSSLATNLVVGGLAGVDAFIHDLQSAQTSRVSVATSGVAANGSSGTPRVSGDGRWLAFMSYATNLAVPDANGTYDVFVRDRGPNAPTTYCTAGTTSNGCVPSIAALGSPRAVAPSGFLLAVSQVEGQRNGLFFYGINGRVAVAWSSGSTSHLCVKSPTQRTPAQSSGGTLSQCDGTLALDWLAFTSATPGALGQPIAVGLRIDAQAWFRDPPAPKGTSLSDALEFDLVP